MENFRPPAMEEVVKKKKKIKILTIILGISLILVMLLGGMLGFKKLQKYLSYLSIEKRYQILKDYYGALAKNDKETMEQLAPTFNNTESYNFSTMDGQYSIYIYPDKQTNKNTLLFQVIDHSITPNISYINEIIYSINEDSENMIIQEIKTLDKGHQIH